MKPWKVIWTLKNYMVNSSRPMHLDGILHHLCPDDPDLSFIGRETVGDQWCYQASALTFVPPYLHSSNTIFRKVDVDGLISAHFGGLTVRRAKIIDTSNGPESSRMYAIPLIWPARIEAHIVAERSALDQALSRLEFFGGERRLGFGEIRSCRVEEGTANGWRTRFTPWKTEGSIRMIDHSRPPYYLRSSREPVYAPIHMMMSGGAV